MLLLFPHNLLVPVSILVNETDQKIVILALFCEVIDTTTTTMTTTVLVVVVVVVVVLVLIIQVLKLI